jgi:hypothetical protein
MFSLTISRRYQLTTRSNKSRGLKSLLARPDGLPCDSPELPLDIVTSYGDTTRLRFFFDTGADLMVIPVYVARYVGIRYSEDHPGTLGSSVGGSTRCYYDFVQVRSSLSGRTHRWVCAFAESLQARLLVGRSGFLGDFAAAVKGHHLIVSRPVSVIRFLKHHAARLRAHTRDEEESI